MRRQLLLAVGLLTAVVACNEAPFTTPESGEATAGPALSAGQSGRNTVVVNPNASGNGVAATIQEGIDMAASGGRVLVKPGTYAEALYIGKGVTVEPIAEEEGEVVLAPPTGTFLAMYVDATDPVVVRGLSINYPGAGAIRADGPVDLVLDHLNIHALMPATNGHAILILNDPAFIGNFSGRARATVSNSFVDAGVGSDVPPHAQNHGIRAIGEVDFVVRGNTVRHTGGACIFVTPRADLTGETNAEIIDNDVDECHPLGRVASILVGLSTPTVPGTPYSLTGTVNVLGNKIRNSSATCRLTSAIAFENFNGRIESNSILGVVLACATPTARNRPSAISIGSYNGLPSSAPSVRFNDISGNAFAGLRLATNITGLIDARCNWWGAGDGPSGLGTGSGDAIVIDGAAPTPTYSPYAAAPIAGTGAMGC